MSGAAASVLRLPSEYSPVFGAALECAQLFIPYRSFELPDMAADGAGGAAVAVAHTLAAMGRAGGRESDDT